MYFDDNYIFDSNEATNPLYASSTNSIEYNFSPISDRQPSSSSSSSALSKISAKLDENNKKSLKSISPVSNDSKAQDQNNSKDDFNNESLLNEINFESETLSELDLKSDTVTPNPDYYNGEELRSSPVLRSSPDLIKSPTANHENDLSEDEFFNEKNVNLFSFESVNSNNEEKSNEPIDLRYKKEYLDQKVFFNHQSRDLPAIIETDAELMEELEMKRLQEELRKEAKLYEYSDGEGDSEEEETESYEYLY